MKIQIRSYLAIMLITVLSMGVYSCGSDDKDEPDVMPSFFSNSTNPMSEYGGTMELSVHNCNRYTTVTSEVSWLTVSMDYTKNCCCITMPENTSSSDRSGFVNLVYRNQIVDYVVITQKGNSNNQGNDNPNVTELTAPANLTLNKNGYAVTLSWNKVPTAERYHIYYSNPSAFDAGRFVTMNSTTSTTFTMDCKIAGNWAFKVQANKGNNYSDYSNTVTTSISQSDINGGGSSSNKPSKPTGLKANVNGTQVSVSWNASTGASYYRLYYVKPSPYDIESFDNVYSTSTTMNCTIKGTWTIWVVAVGADYEASEPSSKVTFNISNTSGGGGGNNPSQLDTPTGLQVNSRASDGFVQIQCNAVNLGYQYDLYRSTSPTYGYSKITATQGSNASGTIIYLTDQNPKSGTTYYKIKATALSYLGIKDSEFSDYVKVVR